MAACTGVILCGLLAPRLVLGQCPPDSAEADISRIFRSADYTWATTQAREYTKTYPDCARIWQVYGRVLLNKRPFTREQLEESERALNQALVLHPTEDWVVAWSHLALAVVYFNTDRDSLARATCEQVIEQQATKNVVIAARKVLFRYRNSKVFTGWIRRPAGNLVFHYRDSTAVTGGQDSSLVLMYQDAYNRLREFWGTEPAGTVNVYIYAGEGDLERTIGAPGHRAFADKREVHTTFRATTGHELCHLFAYAVNPNAPSRLLWEGTARALDQFRWHVNVDTATARILFSPAGAGLSQKRKASRSLTEADRLFDHANDYSLGASFALYLIHTYGRDRFLALYRSTAGLERSVPAIYGVSLHTMESQWHDYLRKVLRTTSIWTSLQGQAPTPDHLDRRPDWNIVAKRMDSVLTIAGTSPAVLVVLGRALCQSGQYERALRVLQQAEALDRRAEPGWVDSFLYESLGDALAGTGHADKARTAYRKAARLYRGTGNIEDVVEKIEALGPIP